MDTATRDSDLPFIQMAERISKNGSDTTAAYVILPPDAPPIQSLVLDTERNPIAFWVGIKTLAEVKLAELSDQEKQRTLGWGMR